MTEKLIKDIANGKIEKKPKTIPANDFVYREYEEKLKTVFGSKVVIHNKENNKGKVRGADYERSFYYDYRKNSHQHH